MCRFDPLYSSKWYRTGTLTITSDADNPTISVTLSGTGGDSVSQVTVTGLDMNLTGTLQAGDLVTFTANAVNTCGGDIYYRFDLVPNYGTDDYDPINSFEIIRNFSADNTYTRTFNEARNYIVVVWASSTASIPMGAAPIVGGSVTVETTVNDH